VSSIRAHSGYSPKLVGSLDKTVRATNRCLFSVGEPVRNWHTGYWYPYPPSKLVSQSSAAPYPGLADGAEWEWHVSGSVTQDGIVAPPHDEEEATSGVKLVSGMLQGLSRFADGGVKAMALDQYWHPKMNWYGPSGIGTNRQIQGFRNCHQILFLAAIEKFLAEVGTNPEHW